MGKVGEENILACLTVMEEYAKLNRVPIISLSGAALLKGTVLARQPMRILEIGTAIGYSTLVLASQMPIGAQIITIEQDSTRFTLAQQFLSQTSFLPRIKMLCGDARQILLELQKGFDFVFIDGAKGQYPDYLTAIVPKLSWGAVVVADNVLFRGMVEKTEIPRRYKTLVRRLREYLLMVDDSQQFSTEICRIGDGIAVSYYKGGSSDA